MKGLKNIREKRNLTLQQVEDLTGVDLNAISRYERGVIEPSSKTALKIAKGLGVSVDELLNGPERQEWILKIRVSIDPQEEEIDMTEGGCISNLDLTRKGAALTLGADYATFEDDSKFEGLINQLRAAREMVVENGRKMLAVGAIPATA